MTFLEYTIERLLGPPVERSATTSSWVCPFCGEGLLRTLPEHPKYKERFRCSGCAAWGDEFDAMARAYVNETFDTRKHRLELWREDFDRELLACISQEKGIGESRKLCADETLEIAFSDVLRHMKKPRKSWANSRQLDRLKAAVWIAAVADSYSVSLDTLMGRVAEYLIEKKREHKNRVERRAFEEYLQDPENASEEVMEILNGIDVSNELDWIDGALEVALEAAT